MEKRKPQRKIGKRVEQTFHRKGSTNGPLIYFKMPKLISTADVN